MLSPGKPHFLAALVLIALCIPCITTAQEKSGGQYDVLVSPKQEEIRFQDDVKVLLGRTGFFSPFRMKTLLAEKEEIQFLAQQVPLTWRKSTYEKLKMDLSGDAGFLFDILGFSVGGGLLNFLQSDFMWGGIWLGTELAGVIVSGITLANHLQPADGGSPTSVFGLGMLISWATPILFLGGWFVDALFPISLLWLTKGFSVGAFLTNWLITQYIDTRLIYGQSIVLAARIGSLICAIIRSVRYNRNLSEALLLQEKKNVSLIPLIDPVQNQYGIGLVLKL